MALIGCCSLTGPLIRTDSNNCCGVLLTVLSWVLIVATMPFSMCLCLKVRINDDLYTKAKCRKTCMFWNYAVVGQRSFQVDLSIHVFNGQFSWTTWRRYAFHVTKGECAIVRVCNRGKCDIWKSSPDSCRLRFFSRVVYIIRLYDRSRPVIYSQWMYAWFLWINGLH